MAIRSKQKCVTCYKKNPFFLLLPPPSPSFFFSLHSLINMNSTDTRVTLNLGEVNPDAVEIASELTSLACITVLAVALGAKTYGEQFKSLNYGRILVIFLYTMSLTFAITSVVVVSTNNSKNFVCVYKFRFFLNIYLFLDNIISCTLGMLSCDFFYAGSKIIGYAW